MLSTKVAIGELDRRITIIKPVIATGINRPSTNEDEIEVWDEVATVWARITPFKGDEAMIAERLTETHHMQADIRYRTDVKIGMRFVVSNRVYDIVSITENTDRMRMMTLTGALNDKAFYS